MLLEVLNVVTPVFVIAGIGFLWVRRGQPFDSETIGSLVMMVGSPCLIYSSLTRAAPDLGLLAQTSGAAVLTIVGGALIAWLFLRARRLARLYLPARPGAPQ